MISDKNQLDPRKRPRKDSGSIIIKRIISQIETETGFSIERLKHFFKDRALYSECLRCTTATNASLCIAIGIQVELGSAYKASLEADKLIWKVNKVYCPFASRTQWTLTTNRLIKSMGNPNPIKFPRPSNQ